VKDLEDYLEIHYNTVEFITEHLRDWRGNYNWSTILKIHEKQGSGGMYLLAKQWADEFQEIYKDVLWGEDLEYYDTIDEFLRDKNYGNR
jgi:hypothetical protein